MDNLVPVQTPEEPAKKMVNKKLILAYAFVGVIILIMLGVVIFNQTRRHEENQKKFTDRNSNLEIKESPNKNLLSARKDNSGSPSKILIHTVNSNGGKVYLYDMASQSVLASSTLVVGNEFNGGEGYGSTYEFNSDTGDIFYVTQGASDYDGACINSDGTCDDRLYKFNIYNGKTTKLKDLKAYPSQWVLNKVDGYLYLSFLIANSDKTWQQSIVKIDPISGSGEEVFNRVLPPNVGLKELVISEDGQYLYQAIENQTSKNGALYTGAALYIFNLKTHNIEEKNIFNASNSSDYLFLDTNLSPNGQYFAYWLNFNLEIYDFQTGKTITIPREPGPTPPLAGAIWSTDSKRLFYGFGGFSGIRYFDLDEGQNVSLKNVPIVNSSPLQVLTSSDKYMIYDGGNEEYYLHLYDLKNEKLITLPDYIKQGGIISDWID